MSVPFDFTNVLQAFASPIPITVYDSEGTYEFGEWKWTQPVAREKPLYAIVLQLAIQRLELTNEGNESDGGISLTVPANTILYFTNANMAESVENKQSYVLYQGQRFRVLGTGFFSDKGSMLGNTNMKLYHCEKWLN